METCPLLISGVRCGLGLKSRERSPDGSSVCFAGHKTKNTEWGSPGYAHHVMDYDNKKVHSWVKIFLLERINDEIISTQINDGSSSVEKIVLSAKRVLDLVKAKETINSLEEHDS